MASPQSDTKSPYSRKDGTKTAKDVVIFIHGITTGFDPEKHADTDQVKSYDELHAGVAKGLKGTDKEEEWNDATMVKVLWGFGGKDSDGNSLEGEHTRLAKAEQFLGVRTDKIEKSKNMMTVNPAKWLMRGARSPVRYGIADMFFYVSRAGRPLVRKAVAKQIMNKAVKDLIAKGEPIELTLFGHSAGSVVAHDFVFFLQEAQKISESQISTLSNSFADDDPELGEELNQLLKHARAGKLKVRKLFTFGSPLHLLFIRSLPVLKRFSDPEPRGIDPAEYGLTESYPGSSFPRWINVLDEDDPIAGPVVGMIDEANNEVDGKPVVEDVFLDTTWRITKAHGSYWWSDRFAKTICDRW